MAPRPRSARQLAERYEVSTRTIERDILALQESGVPVYAETGRCGGYVIDKTLTLPPVNFTAAEMVAIAVALARAEATPFAVGDAQRAAQGARRRAGRADRGSGPADGPGPADRRGPPGRERSALAGDPGGDHGRPRAAARLPGPERRRDRARGRAGGVRRDADPVVPDGLVPAAGRRRAFRLDRILAAADTGEPAPPRSYRDLDVDIPDALVRRLDLAGVSRAPGNGRKHRQRGCRGAPAGWGQTRCP